MTKPFFTPDRYASYTRSYRARVGMGLWLSLACMATSLLIIIGVIMGLSASYAERHRPVVSSPSKEEPLDFSQPAWAVTVPKWRRVRSLPTEPPQQNPHAPNLYTQFLKMGYTAYQKQDYQTALINFRRALAEKEGDSYATEAIANTEAIIQKQRQKTQNSEEERSGHSR